MVVEIANPRLVILKCTSVYNSNVLSTYFLLFIFHSQQTKLFQREYHEHTGITNLLSII